MAIERKTATAILLRRSCQDTYGWRMVAFGDDAEQEYLQARSEDDSAGADLALFKNFKMELFQGGRNGRQHSSVDDVWAFSIDNNTRLRLIDIVSLALEHIKNVIIDRFNKAHRLDLSASDVRWVLTVPAIWSYFGKMFMRTAAYRAGLISWENDMEVWKVECVRVCLRFTVIRIDW